MKLKHKLIIIALWALMIGMLFGAWHIASADRMVLSLDGDVTYQNIPSIGQTDVLLDKLYIITPQDGGQGWMTVEDIGKGDVVDILERALKYIPDTQHRRRIDPPQVITTLLYIPPETEYEPSQVDMACDEVKKAQSNLDKLRETAELHNEIKALIVKLKGDK